MGNGASIINESDQISFNNITSSIANPIWFGLNDYNNDGIWENIDGRNISYNNGTGYSNWINNLTNDDLTNGNCGVLTYSDTENHFLWDETNCTNGNLCFACNMPQC